MKIRLIGRASILSKIQLDYVKDCLKKLFPQIKIIIHTTQTKGDKMTHAPLYKLGDIGFFTKDIDKYILEDKADLAVHCLKDVGSERPKGLVTGAIFNRENPRDILIYNNSFLKKLFQKKQVYIGTSSLRRRELSKELGDLLPQETSFADFSFKNLRGNIETRLKALTYDNSNINYCDGIIIALAGLNRLLGNPSTKSLIKLLLKDMDYTILPLVVFPGAPGQGALCIEVIDSCVQNKKIAQALHQPEVAYQCIKERQTLALYGGGCHQKFGAVHLYHKQQELFIVKGLSNMQQNIDILEYAHQNIDIPKPFYDTRRLSKLATYHSLPLPQIPYQKIFLSHTNALSSPEVISFLKGKEVWVPGVQTFKKISQKGVKVHGCCDQFGYEFLPQARQGAFFEKGEFAILTHKNATTPQNTPVFYTYEIKINMQSPLVQAEMELISKSSSVFWNSFFMYQLFGHLIHPSTTSICMMGNTKTLLEKKGIKKLIAIPSTRVLL